MQDLHKKYFESLNLQYLLFSATFTDDIKERIGVIVKEAR